MSKKKEILKDAGTYSIASLLKEVMTLASSILMRIFLGPLQMGVWGILQIILTYAGYSALGANHAANREIPYCNGKKDFKKSSEIKNIIFSFIVLTSFIFSLGIIGYALVFRKDLKPEIFYGLLIISGVAILQQVNNLLIMLLRSYRRFGLASKQMLVSALVNAVLVAAFSYWFQIYGFLIAMFLSILINIIYILHHHKFDFQWNLKWLEVWHLIWFGFPLLLVATLETALLTIDRIFIASMLGLEALGVYSVATFAWNYAVTLPNSISVISVTNFQEKYGQRERYQDLANYVSKAFSALSAIVPLMIGFIWLFAPYFVNLVLSEFSNGIPALKYLILGAFFIGPIQSCQHFVIAIKKHIMILPFWFIMLFLTAFFDWIFIKIGWGLFGVALATSIITGLKFTALYCYISRILFDLKTAIVHYCRIIFRFFYMFLILAVLDHWTLTTWHPLLSAGLKFLVLIIFFLPILRHLNQEFEILTLFKQAVSKRFMTQAEELTDKKGVEI